MKYLLSSDDHRKGKVTAAPHRDLTQAAPSAVVLPTAEGWSAWASGHEEDAGYFPVSRERNALHGGLGQAHQDLRHPAVQRAS